MSEQLAITNTTGAIQSYEQMESASAKLASSGLMGKNTTPEMVFGLMLLCQCEGLNPIAAMKRYHIVEGRPSMRADAMQAEFLARGGAIIFHVRTDEMVAATLFSEKSKVDDAARKRAADRFAVLWALDCEIEEAKRAKLMVDASKFSIEGEETIIRTFADCQQKGITNGRDGIKANWKSSPRQMLTARVITEGVRLVNPGLIAGIYNEDETADIVRQEREETKRIVDNPTAYDRESILEIIAGYDKELETAVDSRRRTLLGLRSDLVCKLADLDPKIIAEPVVEPTPTVAGVPTKTVEAVVEFTAKKESTKRKAADPTPEPTATRWQDVVCHVGARPGRMADHTLGEIFSVANTPAKLASVVGWFANQALATSPEPKDVALWNAVKEAEAAWTPPTGTDAPKSTTSTLLNMIGGDSAPSSTEAASQPATATSWRAYAIKAKNPSINGKLLGTFDTTELQELKTTYVDQLDPARMTVDQKALAANIALALAELLPPAANEEPEHTTELKHAIAHDSLNRNDFLTVCKANGWISKSAVRLEDVTEQEYLELVPEWSSVAAEVRKAQP